MVQLSIWLIYLYRLLSPIWVWQACRFSPSCSEYAVLALRKYGFIHGWELTFKRLGRCHPPNGGVDYP